MNIDDILTHLGEERSKYFNAVAPPIIQTSNFAFDTVEDMRVAFSNELIHHVYTRGNNPTVAILRQKLAALEHTEDALVVGSGASAVSAAVIANVSAGDHIVCVQKPYSWTYKLISKLLPRFGVSYTFVDGRDINEIRNAIRPETKVLFLESPNSLTFEIQDLEACSKLAKLNNIVSIIDNSHASPLFQNPSDFGIDLVVHSATKYINGHSDVVAGVICGSKEMIKKIFESELMTLGLLISPHDAALIIRGLRTLPLRVHQSDSTALKIAEYLHQHTKIAKIYFPLHPSFDQYELAKKQMKGCGGLITIQLKARDKESVLRFVRKIKRFLMAVSWGGYESLMIPSIVFHDIQGLPDSPIHWSMVRLYVGLESADYLIEDLESALSEL
ncbi:MAG: aminotransferase class I/II-fold pyridoxal phosphate-dependent enzyme [Saprospiraceae bacterium]|nr:aminotransferase class I/II-fold pyridoxal phosphate-dependent enzyme [Saprospiraceae bacterium]